MERIERLPDAVIVRIHDQPCFTTDDHERVKGLLWHAGQHAPRLVLDCSEVRYITGTFLSALIVTMKRLGARPGDIVLCHVSDLVRAVFQATRLDVLFPIVATREDARAAEPLAADPRIVEDIVEDSR